MTKQKTQTCARCRRRFDDDFRWTFDQGLGVFRRARRARKLRVRRRKNASRLNMETTWYILGDFDNGILICNNIILIIIRR